MSEQIKNCPRIKITLEDPGQRIFIDKNNSNIRSTKVTELYIWMIGSEKEDIGKQFLIHIINSSISFNNN